jgi:probable phosphomutase (TIGR03848 family)
MRERPTTTRVPLASRDAERQLGYTVIQMTTLWFVRHAVTADTGKRLTGWAEGVGLSRDGSSQADSVAEALKDVPFAGIYSSPLERTTQTARAIARRQGLQVRRSRDLGEVDYGRWTNRPLKMLARTRLWSQVQRWPSSARFPEGETLRETQARALSEVERIAAEHPGRSICLVSHADVIRLIAAHYLGVHIDLFQRIVIGPASVSVIALGDRGPSILCLNVQPELLHWFAKGKDG